MFLFKLGFTLIMLIFVLGKLSEMSDDKKKKKGDIAALLALLVVLKVFWKPLKNFFINGDRVRESRGELIQVDEA